jgi:peptide/nickel transport system substrate-binding protein
VARAAALTAAVAVALLAVSGAGGVGAQAPKRGGTLVVAVPGVGGCLSFFVPCSATTANPALTQVLEGAFEVGPDLVFSPNLVSRVDVDKKPYRLTYHIRPEARWSDGVPVTASDFLFTYQLVTSGKLAGADTGENVLYQKIRRIRAVDAKTLLVELREPTASWRSLFGVVLPRHVLAGEDLTTVWRDSIDDPRTGRPIGSGPFLVRRFEPGRQLIFVRNPRYWGPHTSYLDGFVLRNPGFDPRDPFAPLRRNEVHVSTAVPGAPLLLNETHAQEIARLPGWRVETAAGLTKEHLAFRVGAGGHLALKNKLVRRALAYGIDREEIVRRVVGRRSQTLDNTVFLASEPFYRANWSGYRYRPAEARRLLEQAGCRPGVDAIYACGGERLSLRFLTTGGVPVRQRTLELIQSQLRQAGVDVRPIYAPPGPLFNQIFASREFDVVLFAWNVVPGGVPMPESICGDPQNVAGYCSRLVMRDVSKRIASSSLANARAS